MKGTCYAPRIFRQSEYITRCVCSQGLSLRCSSVPRSPLWGIRGRRHKSDGCIIMSKMKPASSHTKPVNDHQAIALHEAVDKIMRRFKLEPGMLAGSAYADLHVNDVGLLAVLAEPGDWNVRKITRA